MKIGIISCLAALTGLTDLIDASFLIQKMKTSDLKNARKSQVRGSSTHGRSLISSVGQKHSRFEILTRSKHKKDGKKNNLKRILGLINNHANKIGKSHQSTKGKSTTTSNENRKSRGGNFFTIDNRKSRDTIDNRKSRCVNTQKSNNFPSQKTRASVGTRGSVNILSSIGPVGKSFSISKTRKSKVSKELVTPKLFQSGKKTTLIKAAQNVTLDGFVYVDLPKNEWTEFYFSEVGQLPYSRWNFDIKSGQPCVLQVVDSFCTGDRFQATRLIDGVVEMPLFSTVPVPFDPVVAEQIRLGGNVNCTPFTTDAETAWASPSWSKGEISLQQPGNYKLILKSLLAPYGSGGAFVRLNCPNTPTPTPAPNHSQNVCSYASSSIKYIRQTATFSQQAAVCQSYGYVPLAVTTANIRDARAVLLNCAGAETRAWIASYNGDTYGGAVGLSLHATLMSEGGAISASPDTTALQGVLCQ